ncbi:MAG: aminotransferase class III-fold pyridoxal phosphate-dependent enzyme [Actinobacteria bacterium]|nr:aminotransferase class III-fold pyridoxal phosphate-dependent enzyme [Actinomycetota bacterium]
MTSVLESTPPRFTPDEVAAIGAELFGLQGEARDLGSERDQTFLVGDGVLKISNLGEDAAVLDLEAKALAHIERVDPELPVARLLGSTTLDGPDGTHFVRLFERRHGHHGGPELSDGALRDYGVTHARLARALRGFFHPAAGRELLWDLAHALDLRAHTALVGRRALVDAVLDRYEERVVPRWPLLPAQIVHGDLNLDNVLLDEHGRISAILDFGDVMHSARVGDLAVAVASLMRGRPRGDVFRAARLAVDGYTSRSPLEPDELEVLGDLVATRLAAIVTISAWRVSRYPENAAYIQSWDDDSWALLELWREDPGRWSRELGAARPVVPRAELARRRDAAMGALLTRLTYDEPVHVARGEGVWLIEPDGRRLLDAYNNVPVVGHCHPRVTEAVVRQTRTLNTHARYLYEPLVELSERLLATMPGFDTVMLVNSGSEANDLAWRIARGVTGNDGALITEHAYHGVTDAIADVSPEEWPPGFSPTHVVRVAPDLAEIAIDRPLAATFLDAGLTSDGIRPASAERAQALARATRDAGGIFVADEVQVGHGRSGLDLWAYRALGIEPDVVTLGKPMGNGYPVAALVTRRELVERFPFARTVFSTFGGNPVAARAALTVLDVIEDERLVENAARIGSLLRDRIAALGLEVRAFGLLVGVQLESAERAREVVNALRRDGVLVGRTGPNDDVLKIRPPLVLGEEHVEILVAALERAL